MVKRPKSPEPVEDSRFLTVVHPFPMNANMEVINDFKEFMFWLASIVGKDYALGVYHKPSARGMLVAEVSKSFEAFDKLLGEHAWNRLLRKFSAEERDRKTRVYFSTYSNARALQKDGWKNLLADDELFLEFRPINNKIQHPYPIPVWCDVPNEDPTNKRICRPLPIQTKAPPSKAPVAIPGSSGWISQKSGGKIPLQPEQKGGPSSRGGGSKVGAKNPNDWNTPITSPTLSKSTSAPTSSSSASATSSRSAWTKPLRASVAPTATSSTAASTPRSVSPASAVAGTEYSVPIYAPSVITRSYTLPPPGLAPPSAISSRPTNPVGSSSITMLQTQFTTTSVSAPNSAIASSAHGTVYESDEYDSEDEFSFPLASEVSPADDFRSTVSGDEPRAGRGPGKGRSAQGNVTQPQRNQKHDHSDNIWTKVPQTTARTFRKVIDEDDKCPVHGVICSKGICSTMRRKKRERELDMKRAEREKKRKSKRKGVDDVLGSGKGSSDDDDDDDAKTEVADDDAGSVVTASSRAASMVSSKRSIPTTNTHLKGGPPSVASSAVSSIKGDWGPRRKRSAKQYPRGHSPSEPATFNATFNSELQGDSLSVSDRLEIITASSARPTYGGEGSTIASAANSVIYYDDDDDDDDDDAMSIATVSAHKSMPPSAARSAQYSAGSTVKPTPTRTPTASASVSSPSSPYARRPPVVSSTFGLTSSPVAATVTVQNSYARSAASAVSINSNKSGGPNSVQSSSNGSSDAKGKGKGRANGVPEVPQWQQWQDVKGKEQQQPNLNRNNTTNLNGARKKTWDEMVEEDDSELGSVMEF